MIFNHKAKHGYIFQFRNIPGISIPRNLEIPFNRKTWGRAELIFVISTKLSHRRIVTIYLNEKEI